MENSTFIGASLSDVKVIMMIIRVLVDELPCQAVMEQILALKYLLSCACDACDYVLSCLVLNAVVIQGPRLSGHSPGTQDTPGRVSCRGVRVC
jgi:hypothetical protein